MSLDNIAVGHFADSLAFELQCAYRAVPFSTADDGTLNVAVGCPLSQDERDIVRRGAKTNIAYFIASDAEITAELTRHARFVEFARMRGGAEAVLRLAPGRRAAGELE